MSPTSATWRLRCTCCAWGRQGLSYLKAGAASDRHARKTGHAVKFWNDRRTLTPEGEAMLGAERAADRFLMSVYGRIGNADGDLDRRRGETAGNDQPPF